MPREVSVWYVGGYFCTLLAFLFCSWSRGCQGKTTWVDQASADCPCFLVRGAGDALWVPNALVLCPLWSLENSETSASSENRLRKNRYGFPGFYRAWKVLLWAQKSAPKYYLSVAVVNHPATLFIVWVSLQANQIGG